MTSERFEEMEFGVRENFLVMSLGNKPDLFAFFHQFLRKLSIHRDNPQRCSESSLSPEGSALKRIPMAGSNDDHGIENHPSTSL